MSGAIGCGAMAMPPWSWIRRSSPRAGQRRIRFGQEERQQVAAPGGDLLADDQAEVVVACGMQLEGTQRAVDALVVGDGDQVEVGLSSTWSSRAWTSIVPSE